MRARLIVLSLCVSTTTALAPLARAQELSAENARIVDRFASAVRRAYILERDAHAAALAEIPSGVVARMQSSTTRVKAMVGGSLDFTTIARGRRNHISDENVFAAEGPLEQDTETLKDFYSRIEEDVRSRDDAESKDIRQAVQAFRHAQLLIARQQVLQRLHAFEVKYGPGAPTLDLLEVVENFWLQRVPPFAPGRRGPSPWEVLSGYTTTYVTTVDGQAQIVSAIEVGLRHYDFGYDPDVKSGIRSYLTPRYWSAAFVIGDTEDGALRMPFRRDPRLGAAVSWGDLKVACIHGSDERWRLLFSRQFQLIPHLL